MNDEVTIDALVILIKKLLNKGVAMTPQQRVDFLRQLEKVNAFFFSAIQKLH